MYVVFIVIRYGIIFYTACYDAHALKSYTWQLILVGCLFRIIFTSPFFGSRLKVNDIS